MREIVTRQCDPGAYDALLAANIDPRLARLYAARGIAGAADLNHALTALLPPTQLAHVQDAATLLADAIFAGKRLLIVAARRNEADSHVEDARPFQKLCHGAPTDRRLEHIARVGDGDVIARERRAIEYESYLWLAKLFVDRQIGHAGNA